MGEILTTVKGRDGVACGPSDAAQRAGRGRMTSTPSAMSELERAEIICCLKRMEKNRRNAFLARAETDGDLPLRAVNRVRRLQVG